MKRTEDLGLVQVHERESESPWCVPRGLLLQEKGRAEWVDVPVPAGAVVVQLGAVMQVRTGETRGKDSVLATKEAVVVAQSVAHLLTNCCCWKSCCCCGLIVLCFVQRHCPRPFLRSATLSNSSPL